MTRAQRLLEARGIKAGEAAILSKPSNIFYLSGYTGEGLAVVAPDFQAIVTDSRYTEQAGQQAPDYQVLDISGAETYLSKACDACKQAGVHTVYYEDDEWTVRTYETARSLFGKIKLQPLGNVPEQLRRIKDAEEIARIEEACRITGESFLRILPRIHEGMTERELARILEFDMLENGAQSMGFAVIAAAGVNGSKPHAVPSDYRIQKGDMITMDFGGTVKGYTADMTRTVALGEPSAQMRRVYEVVQTAQAMAQDAVKAGAACVEIDAIARNYIYAQGYEGRFGHGLGHSLGIDVHEEPRLSALSKDSLMENQLVTVEPGIYLPGTGGVRIENTVVVEKDGCRPLITPTRDLIIL